MKKILIGISGSIAAYKTVLLIRELIQNDYEVRVVLTPGGQRFVTPELIAGLGVAVYTDNSIALSDHQKSMLHINLAKWADLIMIAPASANLIAKIANGLTDNLLCEVVLAATGKPLYLAPAMNFQMYKNPATQSNIATLVKRGINLCNPNIGIQACGDTGPGRMQEPQELQQSIEAHFRKNSRALPNLSNKTIVITLGATVEPIDPVRFISNHSSGKMGLAIINSALAANAKVIAIYGKVTVSLPDETANFVKIEALSAVEMLAASLKYTEATDIFIACAAVCDYRIDQPLPQKIKKLTHEPNLTLKLVQNPDVIATVKQEHPHLTCIGFAAETENLINHAQKKLEQKNLDIIIANQVGSNLVFNQDESEIIIIDRNANKTSFIKQSKTCLADRIIEYIGNYLCSQ